MCSFQVEKKSDVTKGDSLKILATDKKEIAKMNKIGDVYAVMYMSVYTETVLGPAET